MPSTVTKTAGDIGYGSPFVNEPKDILHVELDISTMTTDEVDADGYLKPGVPLAMDAAGIGTLVGASNTKRVGIVSEGVKVHTSNSGLAGITANPLVAAAFTGAINRDIVEDNLGRVLSANEIAGLNGVASNIILSGT